MYPHDAQRLTRMTYNRTKTRSRGRCHASIARVALYIPVRTKPFMFSKCLVFSLFLMISYSFLLSVILFKQISDKQTTKHTNTRSRRTSVRWRA